MTLSLFLRCEAGSLAVIRYRHFFDGIVLSGVEVVCGLY